MVRVCSSSTLGRVVDINSETAEHIGHDGRQDGNESSDMKETLVDTPIRQTLVERLRVLT